MKNKIEVFLNREEIRDCFDIEFMLRRGVEIPMKDGKQSIAIQKKLALLKERGFKVKLGSILENDIRDYYVTHRFRFLQEKLASMVL